MQSACPPPLYELLKPDAQSVIPKYVQVAGAMSVAIRKGKLDNYVLPSLNELSNELEISRQTAERVYKQLKNEGLVRSVQGKGYQVSVQSPVKQFKLLLLFNKLSVPKKILYDSFVAAMGQQASVDLHIYNNDHEQFRQILQHNGIGYTHYVILPHFTGEVDILPSVNILQSGKLVLLDKLIPGIRLPHAAAYENFEADIYSSLKEALGLLKKYTSLHIIFPTYSYFPKEILSGFRKFCTDFHFEHSVIRELSDADIIEGGVYINLVEDDLLVLLERINATTLIPGNNVGIISYNETPWKKFILNGITTISTDFARMGEMAAEIILTDSTEKMEVPFRLTLRASL